MFIYISYKTCVLLSQILINYLYLKFFFFFVIWKIVLTHNILEKLVPASGRSRRRHAGFTLVGCWRNTTTSRLVNLLLLDLVGWRIFRPVRSLRRSSINTVFCSGSTLCFALTPIADLNWISLLSVIATTVPVSRLWSWSWIDDDNQCYMYMVVVEKVFV